jgi:O-antigen/teichoic acid export membrane protein
VGAVAEDFVLAVTGSEDVRSPAGWSVASLRGRVRAWLADDSDRSLAQRTAGAAFLIRVASAGLLYLTQVLLARWMGGFEFGIYVYVWTWVLLIGTMVDFGLAIAAQRFIPQYLEHKALDLLRGFHAGTTWLVTGIATAVAALGALGVLLIEPWRDRYLVIPLYLACVAVPLFGMGNMLDGIARTYNWVNLALVPPYIGRPLTMIAVMAAAHFAGLPADAVTAMIAAVVSTWANAIIQLVLIDRRFRHKVGPGRKAYALRTWLATALPIFLVGSFYLLLTYVDILVLQQFRPPEEVAVYYAAVKTLALVAFVNFSVAAAATHKFTEYHVAGDRERLASFLADAIKWTFWPSLAATALILALGKPFLWLFGPKFVDGYVVMFILAVGLLSRAAVGPVERLLNMLGEQRACAFVYAGAFALNLILCLVLIPRFGATGAAVATSCAVLAESILLFFVTRQRLGLHVFVFGGPKARPAAAAEP